MTVAPSSSADGVVWDLSALYAGLDDPRIERDHEAADTRAQDFATRYRGKLGELSASGLREALQELEDIYELMDAPVIFAHLQHAAHSDDPAAGRLLNSTQARSTEIRRHLIFFDLEWVHLEDDRAAELMADPQLAEFAYLLERERRTKPHRLAEGEEQVMDEKANTGSRSWSRLFDEITSRITCEVEIDGERRTLTEAETLAQLYNPNRDTRRSAAVGLTAALAAQQHPLTYVFNVRLQDHAIDDRLRHYPTPIAARNLANEIEPAAVEALVAACEAGFGIVQRYYRLKRRLLGLDELFDYDRYAPIRADDTVYAWDRCREIVVDSYAAFSETLGRIASRAFEERWIDAELRLGKRGGAFSAGSTTQTHPYVLCNYTDRIRDVMTVAHELGHAAHQFLSRDVGYLQAHTPLTTAETASVFGEMLVFRRLLEAQPSGQARLSLLASKIEDSFATVFRQIVMHRFEESAHAARRDEGELPAERLSELWIEANAPMHGDAVTLTDDYRTWWSYIPHFVHSPFYVYAYAFGELLVLALLQVYDERGDAFAPAYTEMLSRGGSVSPEALVRPMGIDLNDPGFWSGGVAILADMVAQAEALASRDA
ncbi:MAG: M3 family oligoendopeptidase [Chloroflexi bacterium]|nr:M3 family oligoendopeptidase [Chloroflexota bacterium]